MAKKATKLEKIAYLSAEINGMNVKSNVVNMLCAVIHLLSKKTKYESDCEDIIRSVDAGFFE